LFERYQGGESAILVHIDFPNHFQQQSCEDKQEFVELVRSANITCLELLQSKKEKPEPAYFVGKGKLSEIKQRVKLLEAPLVLFNHQLSPAQEKNLEKELGCRVIDRIGLILDIFAQRADTFEGKLQVELAQLKHLSTRLIRGWTHLERQKGGIGLRGPGETQLETDRRLLRARMKWIDKRLLKVDKQRQQSRKSRKKAQLPAVSLVGYTNAGKSTLFNEITTAEVYAADKLFATLDPALRQVYWPETGKLVMADTVGFIRHLPHDLVAAFKATLQETRDADLLLHVIDTSDERRDENIEQVNNVLDQIGADEVPVLQIYNKIDAVNGVKPRIDYNGEGVPIRVWLSALSGEGIPLLQKAIAAKMGESQLNCKLLLPPLAGKARALFFENDAVIHESMTSEGYWEMEVNLSKKEWHRIKRNSGLDLSLYIE